MYVWHDELQTGVLLGASGKREYFPTCDTRHD